MGTTPPKSGPGCIDICLGSLARYYSQLIFFCETSKILLTGSQDSKKNWDCEKKKHQSENKTSSEFLNQLNNLPQSLCNLKLSWLLLWYR